MKQYAILTAVGADRVGIVDDLTSVILGRRCNIEESRMAVLGGEFAIVLLFSGEEAGVRMLLAELPARGTELGLSIGAKETVPPKTDPQARPYLLESVSLDTPGIVHSVTTLLRKYGVNIEDLETETTPAPWTGAPLFSMRARLSVPGSTSIARLREELEDLEAETNLDLKLSPITPGEAEF
jgi:glycine cleavage system transcriptional repressor